MEDINKPKHVLRIKTENGGHQGVYMRNYRYEYDLSYRDAIKHRGRNKIQRYRVTYELVHDDVKPFTPEELEGFKKEDEESAMLEEEMKEKGITDVFERLSYVFRRKIVLRQEDSIVEFLKENTKSS